MIRKVFFIVLFSCLSLAAMAQNSIIDAVELIEEEDLGGARKILDSILLKDPDNDAALFYLATCDYYQGKTKDALDKMVKACAIDSTNTFYLEMLATLYGRNGDMNSSNSIYLDLVKKHPSQYRSPYTMCLMAEEALGMDKDSLALDYYDEALLYDEGYLPALIGKIDMARYRGDLATAFDRLIDFCQKGYGTEEFRLQYVAWFLKSMTGEQFVGYFRKVLTLGASCASSPNAGFDSILLDIELHGNYRDFNGMVARINQALMREGLTLENRTQLLSILGDCYHETGDKKKCYESYERALDIDPEYAPVLNNYAYFLALEKKHLGKALKMSLKSVEKEPDNPTYLDTCGWIYHLQKKDKKAQPYFKHAMLYGGKDNKEVLSHYAEVLRSLGEKQKADYYQSLADNK